MRAFAAKYAPLGVFVAPFLPGLRFTAGPLAGATGLGPFPFFLANVLGASLYVPVAAGLGYAVGVTLDDYVVRAERVVREIEHLVMLIAILGALTPMGRRALCAARRCKGS